MSNTPIDISRFRQGEIPGTERKPVNAEVEQLADELREIEAQHKDLGVKKNDKVEALVYALIRADVKTYKYVDSEGARWTIRATRKDGVKVQRGHGGED